MKYPTPESYDKLIKQRQDKTLKYIYFMDKEHPLSDKKGRVYFHRHVYSLKICEWVDSNLHVHHKDEDRGNNHEDNLEAKTPSKHVEEHHLERGHKLKEYKKCLHCQEDFVANWEIFCSIKCLGLYNRLFEITKEELEKLVWTKPTTHIAKDFNVSDSAIGKRCKILGVKKPPRGYWAKIKYKE